MPLWIQASRETEKYDGIYVQISYENKLRIHVTWHTDVQAIQSHIVTSVITDS